MKELLTSIRDSCFLGIVYLFLTFLIAICIKGIALFVLAVVHMNIGALALVTIGTSVLYLILTIIFEFLSFGIKKIYKLCKK